MNATYLASITSMLIGRRRKPVEKSSQLVNFKCSIMITLEKLLTELKAESLNEIVAGKGGGRRGNGHHGHGKGGKKGHGGGSSDTRMHGHSMSTANSDSGSSDC
jgi:hypothetical protein